MHDDTTILKNLSANVRHLLAERGMSQSALARATGERVMLVNSIVNCRHMPGYGAVTRIAEVLETTVDSLKEKPAKKNSRRSA